MNAVAWASGAWAKGAWAQGTWAGLDVPVTGGVGVWKGPAERRPQVYPEYDDPAPKPRKKRAKKIGDQVVLVPGPVVQTGIIEVKPAWDALGELQSQTDAAERARKKRLRAQALSEDEWFLLS